MTLISSICKTLLRSKYIFIELNRHLKMGRGRTYRKRKNRLVIKAPKSNDDDSCYIIELYKFMRAKNWNNETLLKICNFNETGRGLYSKINIPDDGLIIQVPFECIISWSTIENDENFVSLFGESQIDELTKEINYQALLALYLCYQKTLGTNTTWKIYLNSLPKQFDNPYFCDKNELIHVPVNLLKKCVEQNDLIKKNFLKLTSQVPDIQVEIDLFKWAYFVVNTRSVYQNHNSIEHLIKKKKLTYMLSDEPKMILVPFLDLLNHSDCTNTESSIGYDNGNNLVFQIRTKKKIKKYQQLFINYGNHDNTKLLLEYGFIIKNNRHDFMEIQLEDIISLLKVEYKSQYIHREKFVFIREHNLNEQMFVTRTGNDILSHNLLIVLQIIFIEQNIYNLNNVAFGEIPSAEPIEEFLIKLIHFKSGEYEKYSRNLANMPNLTKSANLILSYYRENVEMLQSLLSTFNSN